MNQTENELKKVTDFSIRLIAQNKIDSAMDIVWVYVDEAIRDGRIEQLNEGLALIDPYHLDINICLSVITSVLPVRSKLGNYPAFRAKIKSFLEKSGEDADAILVGL